MARDFSFEEKITDGGHLTILRKINIYFNTITMLFENIPTMMMRELRFARVVDFSMKADFPDEYRDDMDIMAYRTLIGFDYEKENCKYIYCVKIEDYEIIVKSLNFVTLDILDEL